MEFGVIWSTFALCFVLFSPPGWALICLVSGPSPLGLMSGVCVAMLFVYFWHVSYVIPTCPLANGKSPKLMEFINYKSKF